MRAQFIAREERYVLNDLVLGSVVRESQVTTRNPGMTPVPSQDHGCVVAVGTRDIDAIVAASSGSSTLAFSEAAVAISGGWIMGALLQVCPVSSLSSKFEALRLQWERETEYVSSFTQIVTHEAYQKIIGMGPSAVPFILKQLELEGDNPNHWSWALRSITEENPIPDDAAGDSVKIAEAWLAWGRDRYEW